MKAVQIIFPQAGRYVKNITSRGEEEVKVPFLIVKKIIIPNSWDLLEYFLER